MSKGKNIQLFQNQKVRTHWDEDQETVTNCHQLKMNDYNNWGTICTPLPMRALEREGLDGGTYAY